MQVINTPLALLLAGLAVRNVNAQENKVAVHGSIQSDILIPQEDHKIGGNVISHLCLNEIIKQ